MRITGPEPVCLSGWLEAHAVPAVAQGCTQGVAVAFALVQDVDKFGLDHKQALIEDGGHFLFPLVIAVMDHEDQPLTR